MLKVRLVVTKRAQILHQQSNTLTGLLRFDIDQPASDGSFLSLFVILLLLFHPYCFHLRWQSDRSRENHGMDVDQRPEFMDKERRKFYRFNPSNSIIIQR